MIDTTFNENEHIRWEITSPHEYTVTNISPTGLNITVNVMSDLGYSETNTIDRGQSFTYATTSDGVYKVTATLLTAEPQVFTDYIIDFVDISSCYKKLMEIAFCCEDGGAGDLIKDPCVTNNCPPDVPTTEEKDKARAAALQLGQMLMVIVAHYFTFRTNFLSMAGLDNRQAIMIADVTTLLGKVVDFSKSCSFECADGGTDSEEDCTTC